MEPNTDQNTIEINPELSIPEAELSFQYALSGGPGGQHVNKTASKVLLLFNVAESPSLTEVQRFKIMEALSNRIDKEGVLQVVSQKHRSQRRNREEAVIRFQQFLVEALTEQKERKATRPTRRQRQRRLDDKKKQSERKADRNWKWDG
ncbi:MAG: aminoacyl-tRNA hydrolase [Deltaproteobacteria bacterium]|nr:MAG: aminoacyl-tRNA hydrolase [Deltaproteobacteria bacterium]